MSVVFARAVRRSHGGDRWTERDEGCVAPCDWLEKTGDRRPERADCWTECYQMQRWEERNSSEDTVVPLTFDHREERGGGGAMRDKIMQWST